MLTLEIHIPLKNCKSPSVVMRYCFCTIKIYCSVILALRSELSFGHFGATVRTRYTSAEVCWVQHVLGPEVSVSMVACICHLIFFCHNTIFFSKNIVLWQTCHNTIFFEIFCCGGKNKVADTCHHMIAYYTDVNIQYSGFNTCFIATCTQAKTEHGRCCVLYSVHRMTLNSCCNLYGLYCFIFQCCVQMLYYGNIRCLFLAVLLDSVLIICIHWSDKNQ